MFEVRIEESGTSQNVTIHGYINEHATFESISIAGIKSLNFDFKGVTMINSTGISKWIKWVKTVSGPELGIHFSFSNCPRVIIDQINSVVGFLPANSTIQSLYLPYYNEELDETQEKLLLRGTHFKEATAEEESWVKVPEVTGFEPDVFIDKYFHFLKR